MPRSLLSSAGPAGTVDPPRVFDEHGRLRSILERRDVALVPSLVFLIVSLMTIVSALVRPGERDADDWVIGWSLLLSAAGGFIALKIDHPLIVQLRGARASYMLVGAIMSAALGLLAWFDGGLGSVYFTATIPVATYLGLVLPKRWAVVPLGSLGAVTLALEFFKPAQTLTESLAAPLLIAAGWLLGRVGHSYYARAAYAALLRSRSDGLTGTLNRRGFFEQLEYELTLARAARRPVSLLLMDLNGFKAVNDARGHAAGDALLQWVGEQLPGALPRQASAGRLGGDEFAVILPGVEEPDAHRHAATVRTMLASRIGASIGVACSAPFQPLDPDELVRTADSRMYAEKRGVGPAAGERHVPLGRALTDGPAPAGPASGGGAAPEAPPIAYRDVQQQVLRQRARAGRHRVRLLSPAGQFTVLISGLALAQAQLMAGGDTVWDDRLRALMLPWAVANLILIALTLSRRYATTRAAGQVLYLLTTMVLGLGLTFAMLSGSGLGIASPIAATFFLKIIYDGFATSTRQSRINTLVLLGWWALLAALGPATSLWVIPFQVAMFGASRAVGLVARGAFTDGTREMLQLASSDALTGLRNRVGFESDLRRAFKLASNGKPLALLAIDLDDFKAINDTRGHEAGDALLREIADHLRRTFPEAYSIARHGGDEFVAALPFGAHDMAVEALAITELLDPLVGASVGYAIHGEDGTDPDALLQVADARSYEAKRRRRGRRVTTDSRAPAPSCSREAPG